MRLLIYRRLLDSRFTTCLLASKASVVEPAKMAGDQMHWDHDKVSATRLIDGNPPTSNLKLEVVDERNPFS